MYYSLLFLIILGYCHLIKIDDKEGKDYLVHIIPVFILLFITFGFQYNVGTDYFSYIDCAIDNELGAFKLNQFLVDNEYLFAGLVRIAQLSNWPQLLFVLTSLIQNVCFIFSLFILNKKKISTESTLFFYFALSLCFFNQFNGIRQFLSINLIVLSYLLIAENKKSILGWGLLLTTPLFHHSSWIMIIFVVLLVLIINKYEINKKIVYLLSVLCLGLYFFDLNAGIKFIIGELGIFTEYLDSLYVDRMNFKEIITKVIKLVVVFYSIYRLDFKKLNKFELKLMNLSYVTILVLILSFSSTLLWRIYLFFDLFIMIPVLLFYKYDAKMIEKRLINIYLIAFLLVKIILLPQGEYLYSSYFLG